MLSLSNILNNILLFLVYWLYGIHLCVKKGRMGIGEYVFIVYKRMVSEKGLIWNLKVNLYFGWSSIISLMSKVDVNFKMYMKFITGRRRWFINLIISEYVGRRSIINKWVLKYIKWQITLWTYRGNRHLKKLPIYGQRTRSNAKTMRRSNFL